MLALAVGSQVFSYLLWFKVGNVQSMNSSCYIICSCAVGWLRLLFLLHRNLSSSLFFPHLLFSSLLFVLSLRVYIHLLFPPPSVFYLSPLSLTPSSPLSLTPSSVTSIQGGEGGNPEIPSPPTLDNVFACVTIDQ